MAKKKINKGLEAARKKLSDDFLESSGVPKGRDRTKLIKEIKILFSNYAEIETKILAASIRNQMHIIDCAKIGADVITAPLNVLQSLINHPLTDIGMNKFIEDTKKFI